jgi:pimeloyl-ACP methyl ester carboxylesterase
MLALTALLGSLAVTHAAATDSTTKRSCSDIKAPDVPGAKIVSITSTELVDFTVPAVRPILNEDVTGINVCQVLVTLTHPGANDTANIQVWLPLENWNGRFLAAGGSAWAAGLGPLSIAPYAVKGFAATSTDAGLVGEILDPSSWALKPDGSVNTELLTNFASRSIHDMAVVGKAVAKSYYKKAPKFSYWEGCSTGGRQGLVAAQKYPQDFDGIVAGSPATYWTKYVIAELWPQVVMNEAGYYPATCEFAAVREDAVAACDEFDGVKDGVISNLARCKYDPSRLLGKSIDCNGTQVTINDKLVSIVKKIWEGPKTASGSPLWYGLPVGAPLDTLAGVQVNGTDRTGAPFPVARDWARLWVKQNPNFDFSSLDSAGLRELFAESVTKFNSIIDSSDPDLSGFRKAGGKLLVWHGEADHIIFPQDSIRYIQEVRKSTGHNVKDFFRLFIAPGVDHCALGSIDGAGPTDALGSIIDWVEKKKAPKELAAATLPTAKTHFTRKLCAYPLVAKYDGHGDLSVAASYHCAKCL